MEGGSSSGSWPESNAPRPEGGAPRPESAAPEQSADAPPGTGDGRVDQALGLLADLHGLPVDEHPAVFEQVHGELTGALGTLDSGADDTAAASGLRGTPGTFPRTPGS